jgi:hypothetical protein
MGFGTSIFLIAVGAILRFAIKVQVNAVDLKTVGLILMIAGIVGLVFSMIFWGSWGGFGSSRRTTRVRSTGFATDSFGRRVTDQPNSVDYVEEEQRY